MTCTRLAAAAVAIALLSACNSSQPQGEATAAATASPTASPPPTPLPTAIPAAFQGRWGLVPEDCTAQAGAEKGLLTIDADSLKFYESTATLTHVDEATGGRFGATFDFTGEGQSWSTSETFDLRDDGTTLVRRESGEDASPGPFTYTRCE